MCGVGWGGSGQQGSFPFCCNHDKDRAMVWGTDRRAAGGQNSNLIVVSLSLFQINLTNLEISTAASICYYTMTIVMLLCLLCVMCVGEDTNVE